MPSTGDIRMHMEPLPGSSPAPKQVTHRESLTKKLHYDNNHANGAKGNRGKLDSSLMHVIGIIIY